MKHSPETGFVFHQDLAKFEQQLKLAKLNTTDQEILNSLLLGESDVWKELSPAVKKMISRQLYKHRIRHHHEIRDTILADLYLDLFKKKKPLVLEISLMAFLYGMVEILIKRYVEQAKLVLIDSDLLAEVPDPDSIEPDDEEDVLWLALQPFILKMPRKSRNLLRRLHRGGPTEQICQDMGFKDCDTLYARRSQVIRKLGKLVMSSKGNEWLKSKLTKLGHEEGKY